MRNNKNTITALLLIFLYSIRNAIRDIKLYRLKDDLMIMESSRDWYKEQYYASQDNLMQIEKELIEVCSQAYEAAAELNQNRSAYEQDEYDEAIAEVGYRIELFNDLIDSIQEKMNS